MRKPNLNSILLIFFLEKSQKYQPFLDLYLHNNIFLKTGKEQPKYRLHLVNTSYTADEMEIYLSYLIVDENNCYSFE